MSCTESTFDPCTELETLNGIISGRISGDVSEYTIAGRTVKKEDMRTLLQLRETLKSECNSQKAAAKIAAGVGGNPYKIKVRF